MPIRIICVTFGSGDRDPIRCECRVNLPRRPPRTPQSPRVRAELRLNLHSERFQAVWCRSPEDTLKSQDGSHAQSPRLQRVKNTRSPLGAGTGDRGVQGGRADRGSGRAGLRRVPECSLRAQSRPADTLYKSCPDFPRGVLPQTQRFWKSVICRQLDFRNQMTFVVRIPPIHTARTVNPSYCC